MRKFYFLSGMLCAMVVSAQTDSTREDLMDLSLEDLMNVKVQVASQKAASVRETPGAITIISEEDILRSGAVEISELLMQIPGFDPGRDYGNNVSFGVRGNWGLEGKILFMIDGQMMNETSYGSFTSKNRVPLNQIKRIEIIRGPGSVIYGGVASLAVVSIITKNGEDLNGVSTKLNYGYSDGATSGYAAEINAGSKFGKLDLSVHAGTSNMNVSNRTITDFGTDVNYRDSSYVKNSMIRMNAKYKGLRLTSMLEDYQIQRTYEYPASGNADIHNSFGGVYLGGDYELKVSKRVTLIPYIQWKKHDPWNLVGDSANDVFELKSYRTQAGIRSTVTLNDKFSVLLGTEYYHIKSLYLNNSGYDTTIYFKSNNRESMELSNMAGFAELIYSSRFGNLMAGSRFDYHSVVGSAFVPRFAYTKAWNKAHIKLTYSKAFRTPLILNLDLNSNLRPEFVRVLDLEAGVAITKKMYLTVNLYDTKITDAIVYSADSTGEYYFNSGIVGTRGAEAQWQWNSKRTSVRLSYAFFTPYENTIDAYKYENKSDVLLAMPNNKLTGMISVSLHEKVSISSTLMWVGKRYSYSYDTLYTLVPYHTDPKFIWNIFLNTKNLPVKGLMLQAGVKDVLASGFSILMPYQDGLSNVPYMRREFQVRAIYTFNRK